MECPVCKSITTDPEQKKCAECSTDLEIFRIIETLEKKAHKQNKRISLLAFSLIFLVVAAAVFYYFFLNFNLSKGKDDATTISKQQIEIEYLNNEKQLLTSSLVELRNEVQVLTEKLKKAESQKVVAEPSKPKPTPKEIIHVVKRGESLQRIAKKYYGNSDEYQRIMKDNNIKNANSITIGQKLKITAPVTE